MDTAPCAYQAPWAPPKPQLRPDERVVRAFVMAVMDDVLSQSARQVVTRFDEFQADVERWRSIIADGTGR